MTDNMVSDQCRRKPSVFMRLRAGLTPDEHQIAVLDGTDQEVILNWCRQSGKTRIASVIVSHTALYRPNTLSLIVSATQRQAGILQQRVQKVLQSPRKWRKVREVRLPEEPVDPNSRLVRCSVLSLELGNGSEVVSVPASPDTVRGYSPDLLVLDEAARIPDLVYDAIRPMRAAHPCRLICMSTPAGKRGWYYRAWHDTQQAWYRSRMTAAQCPRIDSTFLIEEKRRMSSETMYQQEYECAFIELAGSLFSQADIETMKANSETYLLDDRIGGGEGGGDAIRARLTIDVGVLT